MLHQGDGIVPGLKTDERLIGTPPHGNEHACPKTCLRYRLTAVLELVPSVRGL